MNIIQGDQYAIPMTLKVAGNYITPDNTDEVIIQLNNKEKRYSKSEITYDDTTHQWFYPITHEETVNMTTALLQMQFQQNETIRHTEVKEINVKSSIIKVI